MLPVLLCFLWISIPFCRGNTYATWKTQVFSSMEQADPTISGENANPSRDGISNLEKYALGLDPHQNQLSGLPTFSLVQQNGDSYPTLTYRVPSIDPPTDLLYIPQATTDLQNWTPNNISLYATTPPVNQGDPYFYTYLANLPLSQNLKAFMRLQIQETVLVSLASGNLSTPQVVTLTGPQGKSVYYTIDGTNPSTSAILYNGPVSINSSQTIKAQAYSNGSAYGGVAVASYSLDSTAYPPPSGAPTAPSNFVATSTSGEVDLSWTDNATNAASNLVQEQNSDGSWTTITTLTPTATSYAATGLTFGSSYIFRIIALNVIGQTAVTLSSPVAVKPAPRYVAIDLGLNMTPTKITNSGYILLYNNIAPFESLGYRWKDGTATHLVPSSVQSAQIGSGIGGGGQDITEDGTAIGLEIVPQGYFSPLANAYVQEIELDTWSPSSPSTPTVTPGVPLGSNTGTPGYLPPVYIDQAHDIWSQQEMVHGPDGFLNGTELGNWTYNGTSFSGNYIYANGVNNSGNAILKEYVPATSNTAIYVFQGQTLPFIPSGLNNANIVAGMQNGTPVWWDGTLHTISTNIQAGSINAATAIINGVTKPAYQMVGIAGDGSIALSEMNPTTGIFNAPISLNNLISTNLKWNIIQRAYEGVNSLGITSSINDSGAIVVYAIYTPSGQNDPIAAGYHGLLLLPAELAVDANRDGTIVMANDSNNPANMDSHGNPLPVDTTSQAKPYRFWLNNDEDIGGIDPIFGPVAETVPPDPNSPDCLSPFIVSPRDEEDWSRLWIYTKGLNAAIKAGSIKVGLKWKQVISGSPTIGLITATDPDGGLEYLHQSSSAQTQAFADGSTSTPRPLLQDFNTQRTFVLPNTGYAADFVFPTSTWANLSDANPKTFFLFDGVKKGLGQLEIVFLKSDGVTQIGEGGSVWFDLHDIKEMYQRAIATPSNPPTEPYISNSSTFDDSGLTTAIDSLDDPNNPTPFSAPYDETQQCIIFVHGWYTDYNGFVSYSETMLKRLWWQGYRGRFIGYRWPALSGASTYNPSEWNSWIYGKPFKDYVNSIKGNFATVTVAGHSQGNVVVGSAIQKGLTFTNYILLEAALPTGCYSTLGQYNNYTPFVTKEQTSPTPDFAASLGYRGFIMPSKANVNHYFCFYNPQDFALSTGTYLWGTFSTSWEADQLGYKPDGAPGQTHSGLYDIYNGNPNFSTIQAHIGDDGYTITGYRTVTDIHESMSFVARPRSQAVGADPNSDAIFNGALPGSSLYNLQTTDGFTNQLTDHSGQFNRNLYQVQSLYNQFEQIIAPPTP